MWCRSNYSFTIHVWMWYLFISANTYSGLRCLVKWCTERHFVGTFSIDPSLSVWWILNSSIEVSSISIHLFFWQYSSYIYAQHWSFLHSLSLASQFTRLGAAPSSSTNGAPIPGMSGNRKINNISVTGHSSVSNVAIILITIQTSCYFIVMNICIGMWCSKHRKWVNL